MLLTFSQEIQAADTERRIVSGLVAPYGEVGHTSAGPYVAAAGKVAVDDKENDRSRGIGEGMERLRLCVSLLQKQVHVGAQHSL